MAPLMLETGVFPVSSAPTCG